MDVLTETPTADRFTGPRAVTPLSMGALQQKVEQIEHDAEEGHTRLRQDFRELESHLMAELAMLRTAQQDQGAQLRREIAAAKVEVTNLRMSPATVFAIVMFLASMAGGYLSLRDAIGDTGRQSLELARQREAEIADVKKGLQLQDIKINELTNKVLDALRQRGQK